MTLLQTAATGGGSPIVTTLLPFGIVLVMFYFLLIRPQQAQQKKRQDMLSKLERGDKILSVGGLYGEIVAMREDVLTVKIAEGIEVKMARGGVSQKV